MNKPQSLEAALEKAGQWKAASSTALQQFQGQNFFSRGFLLVEKGTELPASMPSWAPIEFAERTLYIAPYLQWARSSLPTGEEVVILGIVFGITSATYDGNAVSHRLAKILQQGSEELLFDYIEKLSGRFVAFCYDGKTLRVFQDPMGGRAVFWRVSEKFGVSLASHDALISELEGGLSYNDAEWIMNHPDYISPGGKAFAGCVTAHDGVYPLIPNCFLRIEGSAVEHKRFYPRKPLPSLTLDEAVDQMFETLRVEIARWLSLGKRPYLGLTAGNDAAAVLITGLDLFQAAETTALTYHFFAENNQYTYADLERANFRASNAGLRHRVLDVAGMTADTVTANVYKRTFEGWARFPALADSFYRSLPFDSLFFNSLGAEIGTVFYRERDADPLDPQVLARKHTYTKFHQDPRLVEIMAKYSEYVQFESAQGYGWDLFDLFYWENRLGKWAALWFSEMDMATQVALPMSSRAFIEAMCSQPFEERREGVLYKRLWKKLGAHRLG